MHPAFGFEVNRVGLLSRRVQAEVFPLPSDRILYLGDKNPPFSAEIGAKQTCVEGAGYGRARGIVSVLHIDLPRDVPEVGNAIVISLAIDVVYVLGGPLSVHV